MKYLRKNMLIVYNCFLLLGLILSTGAYADHGHGSQSKHKKFQGGGFGQNQGAGQKIRKVIDINQRYAGGRAQINILNYLYNDYQLQGAKLKKIILKAQTDYGNGRARLVINGQRVGAPLIVPTQMQRNVFHVEQNLGQINFGQVNDMSIRLKGNFDVQKIILVFVKNQQMNTPAKIVGKEINMMTNYGQNIKVRKMLGLGRAHNGEKVKFVSLTTQGRGYASVQLVINGSPVGEIKQVSGRKGFVKLQLPFFSGGVLGQDVRSLQVKVDGQLQVTSLMVGIIGQY